MGKPLDAIFGLKTMNTWLLIFFCCLYFVACWAIYTVTVEPLYGYSKPPTIEADATTYFNLAGLSASDTNGNTVEQSSLLSLGAAL